jgi:salicylate hydroxylase
MLNPSIAIIGGGLAGLATAHALAARGVKATIYEAASALGEIGAAVGTSPQANKALAAIGVNEAVAAVANIAPGIYTRNMIDGEFREYKDSRQAADRFGAPFYTFHRADLLDALSKGIDPDSVRLGHRLSGLVEGDNGITLSFENGLEAKADIVIGADGVRSIVRQALYGADNPEYTGQMAWRALLKGSDVPPECLEPQGHVQWIGPGKHFIAYYIRGKELVNIVTQQDTDGWVEESWSTAGDPDEMRRSFADAEPRVQTLLALVGSCSKWGLFARPLTEDWGHGRVQLIGDAAHAMLPNVGQGACQAFEDAYILSRWLDAVPGDPVTAFANFRRIRIPRVHAVQRLALAAARFKHMRDPEAQKNLIATGKGSTHGNMEWVWDYDVEAEWDRDPVISPLSDSDQAQRISR